MKRLIPTTKRGAGLTAFVVVASLLTLAWFGYRAVSGWRRSAEDLAARRAAEAADRLATALTRDMRGAQTSVLTSVQWDASLLSAPRDVRPLIASAFARFPYPESFFAWSLSTEPRVTFFTRSSRRPAWMAQPTQPATFPVSIDHHREAGDLLVRRIGEDARAGRRFSVFQTTFEGRHYQIVARLFYRDPLRQAPAGCIGYTVDLDWARRHYFQEVADQVGRIGRPALAPAIAVLDGRGNLVAGVLPETHQGPTARRPFRLAFFDTLTLTSGPPDLPVETWEAVAMAGDDPALQDALTGGTRTLAVGAVAGVMLLLGLALTARAAAARARLADLRSDFVSGVTHELKTPIAAIRAAGETMARGKIASPAAIREYAELVVHEAKRLGRLVDNVLTYARIADITEAYAPEPIVVADLLDEVRSEFAHTLAQASGRFEVTIAEPMPPLRGDRSACRLLFNNLVDNAIRYTQGAPHVSVTVTTPRPARIRVDVADNGVGIPADEIAQVTRRFVRGRGAPSGGSGLGLAIATRIAQDHGGTLTITSAVGAGTVVRVELPAAGDHDADPRAGR